jgi:hypothetical protein
MTGQEGKDAVGRGQQIQMLERVGTEILGVGIIIMLISVPALTIALLIYLWVR